MNKFLVTFDDYSRDWVFADTWEEAIVLAKQVTPDDLTIKSIALVD